LAWGIFFKRPLLPADAQGIAALVLAFTASLFLTLTARVEESDSLARFGKAYREYMSHTHMFIPFIW
jgi:protein-S-isoprenylcysteine O-methyltransferase Ste14